MTHYNDKIENAWLTHFMSMEPSAALEQIDVLVAKHIEADNTRVAGFLISLKKILFPKPPVTVEQVSPVADNILTGVVTNTKFKSLSESTEPLLR